MSDYVETLPLETVKQTFLPEGLKLLGIHHMPVHFKGKWNSPADRWRKDATVIVPSGTKVAIVEVTNLDFVFVKNGEESDPQPLARIYYEIPDFDPKDISGNTFKFVFFAFLDSATPGQEWIGDFHLRILCFGG